MSLIRTIAAVLLCWGMLSAHDEKLSRLLVEENSGLYLVVFRPGVPTERARDIARREGYFSYAVDGLLPGHLVVSGGHGALTALAGHNEIAYILPADPELLVHRRVYGCAGPITATSPVAAYSMAAAGWPKDAQGRVALQYVFDSLTRKLDSNVARSQVERALSEWARYANISFTPALQPGGNRTIEILFAAGAHGDSYPFTSVSNLAHTFYPWPANPEPVAGDMHLNDAEIWGVGNSIDLFSVALHEAGHALGLGHSDLPTAVMYPYYKLSAGLTSDDIAAIQAMYGAAGSGNAAGTGTQPTPPPPVTPPPTGTPGTDTVAPSLKIVQPNYTVFSTSASSVQVSGTAADNIGVSAVQWTTSTGNSGTAAGTVAWSATIPLLIGTNVITIRAYDAAGNFGWRSMTAVRN
jgi:Matrixin/Glucodextranase, domain B